MISTNPWVWAGALLTISIFSYLWKENPLYRLAEHIFVGISVGYSICITWFLALEPQMWTPLVQEHKYYLIIPIIFAFLMLFRFSEKFGWISFWPLAFLIGFSGYAIPTGIEANLLVQLNSTVNVNFDGGWFAIFSQILLLLGTLACLFYFYFSIPHQGTAGKVAKFGSILLMLSFGASFGMTVMARISLLIGRVQYLLRDWLGLIS